MVLLHSGTFLTDMVGLLGLRCWSGTLRESLTGFQPCFNVPARVAWFAPAVSQSGGIDGIAALRDIFD